MKLYQLGKGVCNYYRKNVKGNEGLSHGLVQKKLTRNIALAARFTQDNGEVVYLYGKLHIYTRGNTITKIKNDVRAKGDWFYKNMKQVRELNRLLGIDTKQDKWKEEGSMDYADEYAKGYEVFAN